MINILEVATQYKDDFNMTFYFIITLVLLIAIFWTYMRIFVIPLGIKKTILKENIIYNNSEDLIEKDYNNEKDRKKIIK